MGDFREGVEQKECAEQKEGVEQSDGRRTTDGRTTDDGSRTTDGRRTEGRTDGRTDGSSSTSTSSSKLLATVAMATLPPITGVECGRRAGSLQPIKVALIKVTSNYYLHLPGA